MGSQIKAYGSLRPYPAPEPIKKHGPNPDALANLEDVRHYQDTPMPWLRYFFPKDFDVREGCELHGAYHHFFDVHLAPVQEDSAMQPPAWAPNAFFRLSFTQQQFDPKKTVDVPGRHADLSSPLLSALDVTEGRAALYREGAEKHLEQVLAFSRHVASFKPRIWKDAPPLVDLLRGVLLYLVEHTQAGVKLAREYALRDALAAQEADRKLVREQAAAELIATREQWDIEAAAAGAALKETIRKQLADELAGQMRGLNEERERWAHKAAAGEAAIKKLTESEAALERQLAALESQMENDKLDAERLVAAAKAEALAAAAEVAATQEALMKARHCILDALQARTKEQVIDCAMEAINSTIPGTSAYVAEVSTQENNVAGELQPQWDQGGEGSMALGAVRQAAEAEGSDGPLATALTNLTPDFLRSPLSAGVLQTSGQSFEQVQEQATLQYVTASEGQDFLIGSTLTWPMGISWGVVASGTEVHVPDVTHKDGVCFLRPGASPSGGSYLAVPIRGMDGEVVGLLGLDTLQQAGAKESDEPLQLGEEDGEYVRALAGIISKAVVEDQRVLAGLMDQVNASSTSVLAPNTPDAIIIADPERYADLSGGKKLLKDAINTLRGLSDEELEAFQSMDNPSEATLAVMRAVLKAAGQVNDGSWSSIRPLITRELLDRLAGLDPEAAWAEWQRLCGALQPVLEAEAEQGASLDVMLGDTSGLEAGADEAALAEASEQLKGSVNQALGRWVNAVRKISAALELQKQADEALKRANDTLLRALSDTKGKAEGGSNALQELRSYRVPPKNSFAVLQAVLQLTGHEEDDCRNWGRMRVLTSYKLVKALTELKPSNVAPKVLSSIKRGVRDMDEADVRKESTAALALFRWLRHFLRCGELIS